MEIRNALTFVIEIDRIESTGINTVVTRQKHSELRTQNLGHRTQKTDQDSELRDRIRRQNLHGERSLETEELRWREHARGSWTGTGLGA